MSIPYNLGIPAASHNPSVDQPNMKINNDAIAQLIDIDHVGFNATNPGFPTSGRHKQAYFDNVITPTAPTGTQSVIYPSADLNSNTNAFFQNPNAAYLLSCVKAFGVFTSNGTSTSSVTASNYYNINSTITKPGPSNALYRVTLNSNVVTGNNVVVFCYGNDGSQISYTFSGGILNITQSSGSGVIVSFAILQG